MKRTLAIVLSVVLTLSLLAACIPTDNNTEGTTTAPTSTAPTTTAPTTTAPTTTAPTTTAPVVNNTVNLMDIYTITDPEGVEYDERIVLYKTYSAGDSMYEEGYRHSFIVVYGKESAPVFSYNIDVYETADQAEAYKVLAEAGETDGNVYYSTVTGDFFAMMAAMIPDVASYIALQTDAGYAKLEN